MVCGTASSVKLKISAPFMNKSSWLRVFPPSASIGMAVSEERGRLIPPVGTIRFGPPLPSVPYANGPIRAFGESSAVSRVAAAASPKIVRTLRSRGLRNLL